MTYIITVQNDTTQQLVFNAASVTEALDKAKQAFTEAMVTGTEQDIVTSSFIQVQQHAKVHIPVHTKAEHQTTTKIRVEDIPL